MQNNTPATGTHTNLHEKLAGIEAKLVGTKLSPANKLLLTKLADRLRKLIHESDQSDQSDQSGQATQLVHPGLNKGAPENQGTNQEIPDSTSSQGTSININSGSIHGTGSISNASLVSDEPALTPVAESIGTITYNQAQQAGIDAAMSGRSLIITGAAGTGKTTSLKGIVAALIDSGKCGVIENTDHKYVTPGTPGIIIISYTNKAVQNVKKRLPSDLHRNCMTAHKFLEYQPVFEEKTDKDTGLTTKTRTFEATRNSINPNPKSIRYLIVDEATMLDVPLWNEIMRSLPKRTDPDLVLILMGDIQQLPPVFGKSIFIHALQRKMYTVELTEVYRQALENPILALAHRVLSGKIIPAPELKDWNIDKSAEGKGKLTIIPWKKKLSDVQADAFLRSYLPKLVDTGTFNWEEDVILCPFNVSIGTELINRILAYHIAKKLEAPVYEIFTGTRKVYLRVGERVLYNKSEAIVTAIKPNFQYFGKPPRKESATMDYNGIEHDRSKVVADNPDGQTFTGEDVHTYVDRLLESMGNHVDEDSPAKRAASHVVTVVSSDTGEETNLSAAGEINNLLLGYSITVHKSQGSEYRRVIFLTTHLHAVMTMREIMYVAITRAKEELIVICEPNAFVKGITTQKIPGSTLEQKIEGFERDLRVQGRKGIANVEQIPIGLERFIPVDESEEGEKYGT